MRFQLTVTCFAFLERAPLIKKALLEVADPIAQVDCHGGGGGSFLRFTRQQIARTGRQLEQVRQFLNLAPRTVAGIDDKRLFPDLAEPKKFLSGDDVPVVDRGTCLLKLTSGTQAQARQESYRKRHFDMPQGAPESTPAETAGQTIKQK